MFYWTCLCPWQSDYVFVYLLPLHPSSTGLCSKRQIVYTYNLLFLKKKKIQHNWVICFHHSFPPTTSVALAKTHPPTHFSDVLFHCGTWKPKGTFRDDNVSVLKPAFHFASLRRHINPNTILKTEISEEPLISLDGRPWHLKSEEVSLQLCFPMPVFEIYFVSLWAFLTGFKALAILDAAKHSHNAAVMSKQMWTGDLTYFLLPFFKNNTFVSCTPTS